MKIKQSVQAKTDKKTLFKRDAVKRREQTSIHTKINLGLMSGLIILLTVGIVSYNNMRSLVEAINSRRQSFEFRLTLERWLSDLTNAEVGQRGYLITGRESYLEPYKQALATREAKALQLKQFDNSENMRLHIDEINQLFTQRLNIINATIVAYNTQGFAAAQGIVMTDKGKAISDQIRVRVANLDTQRANSIQQETARITQLEQSTRFTITAGAILAGLIVVMAILFINSDLAKRKKTQKALAENEARLRAILDSMAEGLVVANKKGDLILFNQAAVDILGVGLMKTSPDQWAKLYGNYLPDKITPFPTNQFPLLLGLAGKVTHNVEIYVKNEKLNSGIFITVSGSPLRDAKDTIIGSIAVFNNITKQKEIEEKFFTEKVKAETTLSSIGDGVFALDTDGMITLFNKAAEQISGYTAEEVIGKSYKDILRFRDETGHQARDLFIAKAQQGRTATMQSHTILIDKHGGMRPVADSAAPIYDSAGKQRGIIVVFRDITAEQKIERELEASNERFELASKATTDAIYDMNFKTGRIVWSEALYSQYGYTKKERTDSLEWWTQHIHPDDAMRVEKELNHLLQGKQKTGVYEYRFHKADGTYAYVRDRLFLQRDPSGEPLRLIGSLLDITKQKELDQAKDEFISLVSHQLRTPLTAIRLFTEMLITGQVGSLQKEQYDYLEKVDISTKRMIQLVGDILNISRIELGRLKIKPQLTDVNKLIQSHIDEVRPLAANKEVTIAFKPVATLSPIAIDQLLFGQIIHNLVTNAIRYSRTQKGKVALTFTKEKNGYVLCVSDNGIGIPAAAQPHIFQRFYRADNAIKVEGEGTGLGLYLIKLIAELSGGKVWFESIERKGATFYVKIPLSGMKAKQGDKSLN